MVKIFRPEKKELARLFLYHGYDYLVENYDYVKTATAPEWSLAVHDALTGWAQRALDIAERT